MGKRFWGLGACLFLVAMACSSSDEKGARHETCNEDGQCGSGFDDCEHVSVSEVGLCTKSCSDESDCASNESCIVGDSIGLEPSCVLECNGGSCPSGLSCVTISDGQNVCLPSAWGG